MPLLDTYLFRVELNSTSLRGRAFRPILLRPCLLLGHLSSLSFASLPRVDDDIRGKDNSVQVVKRKDTNIATARRALELAEQV